MVKRRQTLISTEDAASMDEIDTLEDGNSIQFCFVF
jgi:hypothetical protein